MRKIVAGLFISLDGVVESPDKWHFPYFNDEMGQAVGAGMESADAILLGRRTYEEFAAVWPHQTDDPGADFMNDTPKLVATTTLTSADWANSTILTGNLADALAEHKQRSGKNIQVIGSPTLVRSLLREHLLDELELLVHPIVLGTGKRLFEDVHAQVPLTLVGSATFSTGVVKLTYAPATG